MKFCGIEHRILKESWPDFNSVGSRRFFQVQFREPASIILHAPFPEIPNVCCDIRIGITPSEGSSTNQQSRKRETLYAYWTLKTKQMKKKCIRDKTSRFLHLMRHVAIATPVIDTYSGCSWQPFGYSTRVQVSTSCWLNKMTRRRNYSTFKDYIKSLV